ncbi:MAG: HAMP domain-containing histidine kinase [Spirochaetes bacterium]|nr:HAMP domain-containing histidine kinase [Spirochaetota bacterium]
MSIKRSLFFSNFRMLLISLGAFVLSARIVMFLVYGVWRPNPEAVAAIHETYTRDMHMAMTILLIALFVIVVSIVNNIVTHRMTQRIVKPLEPLNEGVRQIHANNLAYRIDYKGIDEFRPVCEAFDGMAARLEASTAQQKKNEAARRELIAGISHDLRTPLTSIKGYIEGIETGVASTPEMKEEYFAIVKNKTADLEHIIEQLFLFSKLEMDDFSLNLRCVDISAAIYDIIEDSLYEYASRGLGIKFTEKHESVYVSADVLMLRNVIINILENSVKYKTKEQGQMEISIAVEKDFVLMRLTDDGPGVQPEMLPKLFDVFFRTDPSRNKKGSGLGLAINAKIIERMGGSIHAELPANEGLTIAIKLPRMQEGAY